MKKKIPLPIYEISPTMKKIWSNVSHRSCPKDVITFVKLFSQVSSFYRNYANFIFNSLSYPLYSTEQCVADLEEQLAYLLSSSNDIAEECNTTYVVPRKTKRLLLRLQRKNEAIWEKFNKRLIFIRNMNDALFYEECTDIVPSGKFVLVSNFYFLNNESQYYFTPN